MRDWLALFRLRSLLGILPVLLFLGVRMVAAPEFAIIAGFTASVAVYLVNRADAGWILGLSTFALAISGVTTAVALWQGQERIYFAGDPAWDFSLFLLTAASLLIRRPVARVVLYEAMPAVRATVDPRARVFATITLLAAGVFLAHGLIRTALLLSDVSIERYLLISRAVQWPSLLLLVVVIAWLVKRAIEEAPAPPPFDATTRRDPA